MIASRGQNEVAWSGWRDAFLVTGTTRNGMGLRANDQWRANETKGRRGGGANAGRARAGARVRE
eukprot:6207156-Pleurochrysis_carterae.AAC.1